VRASLDRLTLAEAASIMREAVKDKSYRSSPLGLLVGRYLRWFRNEYGATQRSVGDYESILSRMALRLADKDPLEVTLDDLRDLIDYHWSDTSAATRKKVTSYIRSFWTWAEDESLVPFSPAAKLRRPKAERKVPGLLPIAADQRLLNACEHIRDEVAILCLVDTGIRRGELAGIRVRDFDLARRTLLVTGKGRKQRTIPLRGRIVPAIDEYLMTTLPDPVGRTPEPDDFLLYPQHRGVDGVVWKAEPKKECAGKTVHNWWYQRAEAAGLVGKGVRSGLNMHRTRHTFAQAVRREVGDTGIVQHLLGHADESTTIRQYGGYDASDLERGMEALARLREREEGGE
jgi:integrase/recombinase XerC